MTKKISEKQNASVRKYKKEHYDQLNVDMPKGKKERIKAHVGKTGESIAAFVNRAVDETIERDNEAPVQE
jgi:hypothetical protein